MERSTPGPPEPPADIPAKPGRTYKGKGWAGMGDWYGTGNVANTLAPVSPVRGRAGVCSQFRPQIGKGMEEVLQVRLAARRYSGQGRAGRTKARAGPGWATGSGQAQSPRSTGSTAGSNRRGSTFALLGAEIEGRSGAEYGSGPAERPDDIPAKPGWGLQRRGLGRDRGLARDGDRGLAGPPMAPVRVGAGVRRILLGPQVGEGVEEVRQVRPSSPMTSRPTRSGSTRALGLGWGTGSGPRLWPAAHRQYLPFEEARALARSLGLKSQREWSEYARSDRRSDDIPANPRGVYEGQGLGRDGRLARDRKRRE